MQGNYPYVSDCVGGTERHSHLCTILEDMYSIFAFPLDLVPQQRTLRVILVNLRIPSLAQSWASRAALAILDLIGVVKSRDCLVGAPRHVGQWTIILAAPHHCRGG